MSDSSAKRPYKVFLDGFLATYDRPLAEAAADPRLLENGRVIHAENYYVDEPFTTIAADGAWVCGLSIADGQEADRSQHTEVRISRDQGRTWSPPQPIEPLGSPENARAVLFTAPSGRIFIFYTYNTEDLREVAGDNPPYETGTCARVDAVGDFVFKYSDDNGTTWSDRHYVIPMRVFDIDRENPYGGEKLFFWNVGIPLVHDGAVFVPMTKIGAFGDQLYSRSEGALFKSPNLLTEPDPDKILWETLPDGPVGLRAPEGGGPIAEEHSFSVLSDGSFFVVYRTIDGHPACAYSRDGGHSWSAPRYMTYPDGQRIKHSRAANFAWRLSNGRFLYWFHNHGGPSIPDELTRNSHYSFENRNPVWLLGGEEIDSPEGQIIQWSQPEIALYADDPFVRMSYPDLIEDGGSIFITETNKDIARVHEIPKAIIDGLGSQFSINTVSTEGLLFEQKDPDGLRGEVEAPRLPEFRRMNHEIADYRGIDLRGGFTIDLWISFTSLESGQVILDGRRDDGRGYCLRTTDNGAVEIVLNDGMTRNHWDCDPGILKTGVPHHIAVIVDGGPKIIGFVVDGRFCDGGDARQWGWGRFSRDLRDVNGAPRLRIAPNVDGMLHTLRLYSRALRTSEAIGNWRQGCN